ncbi:hypothetical protein [Curtobacterium sp. MCBA15_001]|uniref:hypothetical protein n=1 Tax=Curtobacterium sp. MCBA15_001 TaxID=1898731 RepID=UPI00091D2ECA|nr:hypothetical protein [Curtobacterium sp. MCBA15_001]OIH93443.1 hypothetical protein BIU90_07035 [Curtobacterium sp. MCBA15_001]
MELDDFVQTDRGLMVRGASPELLDELLVQYGAQQRAAGFDPDERLRPGLSRAEILDPWAERGVVVPEEIVRLWQWPNGGVGDGQFPGAAIDSIEQSLGRWDQELKGVVDFLWDPDWITVCSHGVIAVKSTEEPPLVRGRDGVRKVEEDDVWDPRFQLVSICTLIAMSIYGDEHGLFERNAVGLPDTRRELWPTKLEITKLHGW